MRDILRIQLPGSFLALLCSAFQAGFYIGGLGKGDAEDLEASVPCTTTRGEPLYRALPETEVFRAAGQL